MPEQTTDLYVLEDLADAGRTKTLATGELSALQAVADWIRSFVARPNKDLGRSGPVCPFVPGALEAKTLWLAPEQVVDRSAVDIVDLVTGYKSLFLETKPTDGDGANYKALMVVMTDLPADNAKSFFESILQHLAMPFYADDGLVVGGFYEKNDGPALYNPNFRPFTPPVPFLLMRHAVVGDWKFFLDDNVWLDVWARRFGASAAVQALAEELRRLPWRTRRD